MGPLHRLVNPLLRLLACGVLSGVLCGGLGMALATPASPAPPGPPATVQVQDGDMASVLALRLKPRGATIEQMMVALLARNPDAFILGNVNLLKQGAVLRLPPAEEVLRIAPEQAREIVQRHEQASLSDLQAPAALPLTAAAPAVVPQATTSAPEADPIDTAAEREALRDRLRQAKARLNELQQNIQELERLTQTTEPKDAAASEGDASPGWPTTWIWLGVAAIVAIMVGVGYSRVQRPPEAPKNPTPSAAAAEFQARLNSLDLELDSSPRPPPWPGRTP